MQNLAYGKATTASSSVLPYSPARAVNGNYTDTTSRWLCNTLPGYMIVDLGAPYWFDRWVVKNITTAGWLGPNYNMQEYRFDVSNDGKNWTTADSITGNVANITDRTIPARQNRYVRLYVTKGIACNTQLASCMELEVYEAPPTSSLLSALTISQGTLTPTFSSAVTSYTATVDNDVTSITLTPTSIDGGTITVNGVAVASGSASAAVPLDVGTNTIPVVVTSRIGSVVTTYNVVVTRLNTSAYLSDLLLMSGFTTLTLNPTFTSKNLPYTATCTATQKTVMVTPTASDSTAVILVNGVQVQSSKASAKITVTNGMVIPINVTVSNTNVGTITKDYSITITVK